MQRREEERLLQLQKQRIQQELVMRDLQRKQEESQRYKKEIMLEQLRREHEEREKHKAMLKEFQHIGSGNSLSINSNFLDQSKREEDQRRREQIERERNKQ